MAAARVASKDPVLVMAEAQKAGQSPDYPGLHPRFQSAIRAAARASKVGEAKHAPASDFACYCGAADAEEPAEDGFTDLIQAMIFHMSSSDLTISPIGGIGPTTFSEPLRL